jgi:general secretion pathway protein D
MGFRKRSAGLTAGALALTMGLGLLAASPSVCRAQEASVGQRTVQHIDLVAADLIQAIQLLKQQTGAEIVLLHSDKPYAPVTLTLHDKSLDVVLKHMARNAGASVTIEDGIYVIGPKQADKPAANPAPQVDPAPAPPARRRTEKIRLTHSRASELKVYIEQIRDPALINQIERGLIFDLNGKSFRNPFANFQGAKPPSTIEFNKGSESGDRVPPVVPTGNDAVAAPRSGFNQGEEGQLGGIGGGFGGGGLGGGGQGGLGGGLGGQGRGGLGGGQGGGGQQAQNLLPEGIDSVLAYDVDNTLIVRGTDEGIRELKEIVRLLDIAPRQLSIRAEFITVQQDDLRTFGINFDIARGSLTASTGPAFAQGEVALNYATGNLVAALRTSLVEGKGRLINSPMATTTNNVPVVLTIGTTVPIITNSVAFGQGGQGITIPQINPVQVVSGLFVIPRINGDNSITMTVSPFIQDIVSEVPNPAGGTIPIITTQNISVVRRIGNRETLVIGGLVKKNDRSSIRRVPLLADLPFIGQFFRGSTSTIADSELLIFVTPEILPEPVSLAAPGSTTSTVRP